MSNPTAEKRVVDGSCGCSMCVARTSEMYELPIYCTNCGWSGTGRWRKGDKAKDLTCPACGCWNTAQPRIP